MMRTMAVTVAGAAVPKAEERTRVDASLALAVLRVLTGAGTLYVFWLMRPWDFADLGLERHRMVGAWLIDPLPDGHVAMNLGAVTFACVLVAVTVGWHTRIAAWMAFGLGFWMLGTPQGISGSVHVHHILVFLAIVAAGPSDSRLAVRPGRVNVQQANVAMAIGRAVVGMIYLFPGLAKLGVLHSWVYEFLPAHIDNAQSTFSPILPGPPHALIPVLALGAVAFEVSFLVLVFTRFRVAAVASAICFHLTTGLTMTIWFVGLVIMLPAFLFPMETRPWKATPDRRFTVAGLLLVGTLLAGVTGTASAWPVAHYPKFAHQPEGTELQVLVATTRDGDRYRAGRVLLPRSSEGYWGKIERTQPAVDMDAAVERRLGEPVTLTWERQATAGL